MSITGRQIAFVLSWILVLALCMTFDIPRILLGEVAGNIVEYCFVLSYSILFVISVTGRFRLSNRLLSSWVFIFGVLYLVWVLFVSLFMPNWNFLVDIFVLTTQAVLFFLFFIIYRLSDVSSDIRVSKRFLNVMRLLFLVSWSAVLLFFLVVGKVAYFNDNWVGLGLFFLVVIVMIMDLKRNGVLSRYSFFLLLMVCGITFLMSARGVFVASTVFVLLYMIGSIKYMGWVSKYSFIFALGALVFVVVGLGYLEYSQEISELEVMVMPYSGSYSLTSGRSVVWGELFGLLKDNGGLAFINTWTGFGLSAMGKYIFPWESKAYVNSHNFVVDGMIRVGLVGVALKCFILLSVWREVKSLRNIVCRKFVYSFLVSALVLGAVYDILGFTHLSGNYVLWLLIAYSLSSLRSQRGLSGKRVWRE